MTKVGNQTLVKGDTIKAPNSNRKWVVTRNGNKVEMINAGKKITKKSTDLMEWIYA